MPRKPTEARTGPKMGGGATRVAETPTARQRASIQRLLLKMLPKGAVVRFRKNGLVPAYAWKNEDGRPEILTPKAKCNRSTAILAHEVAHVLLKHIQETNQTPGWLAEYEAEVVSLALCEALGEVPSKTVVKEAKAYVRRCMREEGVKLTHAPEHVQKWLKS